MKKVMLILGLLLMPAIALAHPGHAMNTSWQGFVHPFSGLDHLLVMLAVGFFAARQSQPLNWQLPLLFLGAMTAGLTIGAQTQTTHAWAELAVALSVISMGFVILFRTVIASKTALTLIAVFAGLHGFVHGQEMTMTSNWFAPVIGILLATATLLSLGYLFGAQKLHARIVERLFAGVLMLAGAWLSITI